MNQNSMTPLAQLIVKEAALLALHDPRSFDRLAEHMDVDDQDLLDARHALELSLNVEMAGSESFDVLIHSMPR